MSKTNDTLYDRVVSIEKELMNLRQGYVIVNDRYNTAMGSLTTVTHHSVVAAQKAALSAQNSETAASNAAKAAQVAAEHDVVSAAQSAAGAAHAAAEAATEAAQRRRPRLQQQWLPPNINPKKRCSEFPAPRPRLPLPPPRLPQMRRNSQTPHLRQRPACNHLL